jgi:hypothetical protein
MMMPSSSARSYADVLKMKKDFERVHAPKAEPKNVKEEARVPKFLLDELMANLRCNLQLSSEKTKNTHVRDLEEAMRYSIDRLEEIQERRVNVESFIEDTLLRASRDLWRRSEGGEVLELSKKLGKTIMFWSHHDYFLESIRHFSIYFLLICIHFLFNPSDLAKKIKKVKIEGLKERFRIALKIQEINQSTDE